MGSKKEYNQKKRRQILSPRDVSSRHNVRNVTAFSQFDIIERIYAEAGVVRTILKDGTTRTFSVKDAAIRAAQINYMAVPEWHVNRRNQLVNDIVDACKEAKRQAETDDPKALALKNLMEGKDTKGAAPKRSEDTEIQFALITFPYLNEDEVRSVLREEALTEQQKNILLSHENSGRMNEAMMRGELVAMKPVE